MIGYALVAFRTTTGGKSLLAWLLWLVYFGLGASAALIAMADVLQPVYPPNYHSVIFMLLCVVISISGFSKFRSSSVQRAIHAIPCQRLIENVLVMSQFAAIMFFTPFAASSLAGDANENRLELASKMELLGSYGLLNTAAGAASQLFVFSLVMAFIRLSEPALTKQALSRAALLLGASLSYVVYILAYVGRDGVVYWLMTVVMMNFIFRPQLGMRARKYIFFVGLVLSAILLIPFTVITLARFIDSEYGSAWSILDYFGSQINNFSDYSSIDRPLTLGAANFPMFISAACSSIGLDCPVWGDVRDIIFEQYLSQNKAPWLFGTFISDFVGDFGYWGTLALLIPFALLCNRLCSTNTPDYTFTLARLLLIVFLFLVPYWGVFYFRFSIINGFIIVNLAFILFVKLLHRRHSGPGRQHGRGPGRNTPVWKSTKLNVTPQ
jgi:hypothetical protein